ncbi:serine hydrolase [Streptomyces sp. NRRL F-5126]|uniref:serine hydrolase n=1 Tax=Streptomyces sp. NRRL F-5126 TaxID=1463857 RepID=UPI0004CA9037|nr:serine hydrolase [Streptomyces sp. NRRL F-5126]
MNSVRLVAELRGVLADAGLAGSFLVRDLASGEQVGIDADRVLPVASLVKLPLALAVLQRRHAGLLDGAEAIDVLPGGERAPGDGSASGPVGLSRFSHPARVAVDDLLYLSVSMSDNAAADALFGLVPPRDVHGALRDAGFEGIAVRHRMRDLSDAAAGSLTPHRAGLAHALAIGASTPGQGHQVAQLDASRANAGSARAFADLLHELWQPTRVPPEVAERLRLLMRENVFRQRLAPDFASDAETWSSKTGTLLNLRHEVGVVEHEDGDMLAVAALTESRVPAAAQPAAEAAMARVARALHDHLRGR